MTYNFNIAGINQCTEAEGPFKRLAIWFQGCDKQCLGCCNPELFPIKAAHILSMDQLISIILEAKNKFDIEGITCLGGEPVLQHGLPALFEEIRKLGLGILLFTGRKIDDIPPALVHTTDLIIDGGFEMKNIDKGRNLIGSNNQQLNFITERYKPVQNWFYDLRPKNVEINIIDNMIVNGDYIFHD